jgi:PAS domain S-box-containing protein
MGWEQSHPMRRSTDSAPHIVASDCTLEVAIPRVNRSLAGYVAAVGFTTLAVGITVYVPLFTSVPWILSVFAVAIVAWVGGIPPAIAATLLATCGIYGLILGPASHHSRTGLAQAVAFDLIALLIAGLVSHRNRVMSLLKSSETHYRSVTETASDVVITIDSKSRILSINPAVREVFGYEPAELIGKEMPMLMPERYRGSHKEGLAKYLATGIRHIPWTGVQLPGCRKNGEEIPLEISFGSYQEEGEQRFTGFIRDITDRRKAEAALMQSEKLAAVGRLASSIAHEINNPLSAVMNLLHLSERSSDLAEIKQFLELAQREVRRVAVIANQTLQFHGRSSTPEPVRGEEAVSGSLALYQGRLLNAQIRVEQRHRATRLALCIAGEIRQVLNNLIGNAIDALPADGGRILIRSRDATDWSSGRQGIVLTFGDTGYGMSRETRQRAFEPFFSTKGPGGTGLGLWICSQLVAQNRGKLRVRSRAGSGRSGTVVTLFLPHSEAK